MEQKRGSPKFRLSLGVLLLIPLEVTALVFAYVFVSFRISAWEDRRQFAKAEQQLDQKSYRITKSLGQPIFNQVDKHCSKMYQGFNSFMRCSTSIGLLYPASALVKLDTLGIRENENYVRYVDCYVTVSTNSPFYIPEQTLQDPRLKEGSLFIFLHCSIDVQKALYPPKTRAGEY
mgnify:CR=1 FL=1